MKEDKPQRVHNLGTTEDRLSADAGPLLASAYRAECFLLLVIEVLLFGA